MAQLKLGAIADDKPIKLTVELPAAIHRDLVAYADALGRETGQDTIDPAKLVAPMLARFIAGDRAFANTKSGSIAAIDCAGELARLRSWVDPFSQTPKSGYLVGGGPPKETDE